jgi:broad specificity phosphatase PhoE
MKTVHLVRHGESEGNVGGKWQTEESSLTQNGREQASLLANRLATYPFDVILSSKMKRAMQTADIIADHIKVPIESTVLLNERRRPTEQLGIEKNNPEALLAEMEIKTRFDEENFRFSDEENFSDLKYRVQNFFHFLKDRKENNILVVTHEIFMRMIAAYIAHGEDITSEEGKQFFRTFHANNTGMSIIRENQGDNKSSWDLLTWNDYSHLININT